jgi:hypothetical protein
MFFKEGKTIALKKFLGALTSALIAPLSYAVPHHTEFTYNSRLDKPSDPRGHTISIINHNLGTEEYQPGLDDIYSVPAPWSGQWGPMTVTTNTGVNLDLDARGTNSSSVFNINLRAFMEDGNDINATNYLRVKVIDNGTYDSFDPFKHYFTYYSINSNFTQSGQNHNSVKNLRDFLQTDNGIYVWEGALVFINSALTNMINNSVKFGDVWHYHDWNSLSTTSNAGGSNFVVNAPGNLERLIYNTNLSVVASANTGYILDSYTISRTDSTGGVNTVVHPGNNVLSTNVLLEGLMGNNIFSSTFAQIPTTTSTTTTSTSTSTTSTTDSSTSTTIPKFFLNVDSEYGNPTGEGSYPEGTVVTSVVEDIVNIDTRHRKRVTGHTVSNTP